MQGCVQASMEASATQGPLLCVVSKKVYLRCHKKNMNVTLVFAGFGLGLCHRSRCFIAEECSERRSHVRGLASLSFRTLKSQPSASLVYSIIGHEASSYLPNR